MSNPFEVEVPAPLAKFYGATVIDPQNEIILSSQEAARILDSRQLKRALKRLGVIEGQLRGDYRRWGRLHRGERDIDAMLLERKRLYEEWAEARIQLHNLKHEYQDATDSHRREIVVQAKTVKRNLRGIRGDLENLNETLLPLKPLIIRRNILLSRIEEHYTGLEDKRKNRELTAGMAQEANYFADILIRTFDQMGYCYDYHTRKGKHKRRSIQFERVIATPDTLQFKVYVTKRALIKGTINKLPPGVEANDLIQDKTLLQLHIACERPVRCDSKAHDKYMNGLWFAIDRTGIVDGLPESISYKTVMASYPGAKERHRFPLLLGIKQGRHLNKINLADNPHFLIAGQTGSGKTVAYHGIICTLISNYSPSEVRLVFIDLKEGVAFLKYQNLPHTLGRIIEEAKEVPPLLAKLEALRRARMIQIRSIAEDINEYNALVPPANRIPRIVVCCDEYGALNGTSHSSESYALTSQLAKKGRAAGIHLIVGAQTPYVTDVPQSVKANLTYSIVGKQKTLGASISSTGDRQAYDLPDIPGRMLAEGRGSNYPVQLPMVEAEDIARAIEIAMEWGRGADLFAELDNIEDREVLDALEAAPKIFSEQDFIDVVLDNLDGVISVQKVYEAIGGIIPRVKVDEMSKSIIAQQFIEHRGGVYELQKYGRGYKLVSTEKPKHHVSPFNAEDGVTPVFVNGHVQETT